MKNLLCFAALAMLLFAGPAYADGSNDNDGPGHSDGSGGGFD